MIKKHSIFLLSTLFIISTSSVCSGPKEKFSFKKHPNVVPATGTDKKDAEEEIHNSPTSPAVAARASGPTPQIIITQQSASPKDVTPSPLALGAAAVSVQKEKVEKQLKPVTLVELIDRQKSVLSLLSTSASKKLYGADVVILGALAGLKKAEENLDCRDAGTQAQLGSAVEAIIKEKNLPNAEELLRLSQINEIFLDKTYREKLREFVSKCQKEKDDSFQEEYNKECSAIKERLKKHIAESKKFDGLIDGTYQLGGKRNLTEDELAFLQGDKSKLTKEQQQALAKKQNDRMRAGLSDNEEEHPEYVDPQTIIKVPASQLSALKPGSKSLKAKAVSAAAPAKK